MLTMTRVPDGRVSRVKRRRGSRGCAPKKIVRYRPFQTISMVFDIFDESNHTPQPCGGLFVISTNLLCRPE